MKELSSEFWQFEDTAAKIILGYLQGVYLVQHMVFSQIRTQQQLESARIGALLALMHPELLQVDQEGLRRVFEMVSKKSKLDLRNRDEF